MTTVTEPFADDSTDPAAPAPKTATRRRRAKAGSPLLSRGEPMIWLSGSTLWLCVLMIAVLLAFVGVQGVRAFWPGPLVRVTTIDGATYMGEIAGEEVYRPDLKALGATYTDNEVYSKIAAHIEANGGTATRWMIRIGNYELTNRHYVWVSDYEIVDRDEPNWALLLERRSAGRFYGFPKSFQIDGEPQATDASSVWALYERYHDESADRVKQEHKLGLDEMGEINDRLEDARVAMVAAERTGGVLSKKYRDAKAHFEQAEADAAHDRTAINDEINALRAENARYTMAFDAADGQAATMEVGEIVRAFPANQLGGWGKLGVYLSRWWEFLSAYPREANSAGGVWPAIFGTVLLTLLMSVAVVPFGVLAALYLREYAKQGAIVSVIRIAINNLAGVPSIVFGVFGFGFFCYKIGKYIDGGPENVGLQPLSAGNWFLGIGVLVLVVVGAVVFGMLRGKRVGTETSRQRAFGITSILLWLAATGVTVYLVATTPFFDGFYVGNLPNPTFGKGALIWAALTLALLTLPVVIVATEEALSAVPSSMREGSYAAGGSKWQTIWRIVLPRAMPGIMTGAILAMARGAGEVAPLMLVGAVKTTQHLPIAATPPFGANRSFMHLGFHIWDLGYQSQNSVASKPLIFSTTLLLIAIIAILNITAIWLRGRLRKKFVTSQF